LLRGVPVVRANQVWSTDITYVRLARGFAYLVAVIDWYSRRVLSWRISNSMEAAFCVDCLEDALREHGKPEVFNSDQGSQYCGHEFQSALAAYKMKSSMSRKGYCWDSAPTESVWGCLKVGRLYGRKFETRRQAMDEVIDWMTFYNHRRIHSTLGYVSPMQFEKSWHAAQLLKTA
jgi:transposase InsO family protein